MAARLLATSVGWVGISMVSDGVPALLLPYHTLAAGTRDATTVGITTLLAIGLAAALQPVAGRASDRIGRWPIIMLGGGVAVAGLLLLTVPAAGVAGAIVTLGGVSIGQAGYQPLAGDRIARRWRGRAAGLKGAFDVGGAFLGFVVLGALLGTGEPLTASVVLAVGLVLPFLAAYAVLRPRSRRTADGAPRPVPQTFGQESAGALLALIGARFLFLLGIYVVGRFLLLFVADRFQLAPDAAAQSAGGLLAGLALLTVIASLPSGWLADRFGRPGLMLAGGLLAAIGIGLLPISRSLEVVAVGGGLMAVGTGAFGAGSWAALTDLSAAPNAGRLMGVANFGTAGAAALAGALGVIIDAGNRFWPMGGYVAAFGFAAAVAVAGGLIGGLRVFPHDDRLSPSTGETH